MEILRKNEDINIIIPQIQRENIDLGREENFKEYEDDALLKIINPIENYETVRFIHKEYGLKSNPGIKQYGIWYEFYLLTGSTYVQNYEVVGISPSENAKMLKTTTESFFRLEFFKTPNNEPPTRENRRLVMTRNLVLPSGERHFDTNLNNDIFVPIFSGSNYRNKDIIYLYWFKDDSAFNETTLTGNTFWVTAKFFNATDGSIIDFVNKDLSKISPPTGIVGNSDSPIVFYEKNESDTINEYTDLYYKMVIDRNNYSYQMFRF